jgi:hypothetical protein
MPHTGHGAGQKVLVTRANAYLSDVVTGPSPACKLAPPELCPRSGLPASLPACVPLSVKICISLWASSQPEFVKTNPASGCGAFGVGERGVAIDEARIDEAEGRPNTHVNVSHVCHPFRTAQQRLRHVCMHSPDCHDTAMPPIEFFTQHARFVPTQPLPDLAHKHTHSRVQRRGFDEFAGGQ